MNDPILNALDEYHFAPELIWDYVDGKWNSGNRLKIAFSIWKDGDDWVTIIWVNTCKTFIDHGMGAISLDEAQGNCEKLWSIFWKQTQPTS